MPYAGGGCCVELEEPFFFLRLAVAGTKKMGKTFSQSSAVCGVHRRNQIRMTTPWKGEETMAKAHVRRFVLVTWLAVLLSGFGIPACGAQITPAEQPAAINSVRSAETDSSCAWHAIGSANCSHGMILLWSNCSSIHAEGRDDLNRRDCAQAFSSVYGPSAIGCNSNGMQTLESLAMVGPPWKPASGWRVIWLAPDPSPHFLRREIG
jgi:hypothetical protein